MRVKRTKSRLGAFLCAAGLVAGLLAVTASPASAATIIVGPGQSIQAAVDAAPPGSTILVRPGTYHETVTITRAGIRLQGSGANLTTILPPANPGGPCAFGPDFVQGVCVLGNLDQDFNVVSSVRGVSVTDIAVSGFTGSGIFVSAGAAPRSTATAWTTTASTACSSSPPPGPDPLQPRLGQRRGRHLRRRLAQRQRHRQRQRGVRQRLRFLHPQRVPGTISNNQAHDNCMGMFFLGEPEEPV